MEIIFAAIYGVLEFIIGFLIEIFIQVMGQVLVELGFRSVANVFVKRPAKNPVLAAIGYFVIGGITGLVSLYIFSESYISSQYGRIANLIFTPLIAGLAMSELGKWRRKRGQDLIRMDSFSYGFLFAFGMVLARFVMI
jgi:hypothetical protein